MPRRNRPRRNSRRRLDTDLPPVTTDTDQMARQLVSAGKADPVILGPMHRPWVSREGVAQ